MRRALVSITPDEKYARRLGPHAYMPSTQSKNLPKSRRWSHAFTVPAAFLYYPNLAQPSTALETSECA
jgi:hypothetical protein